MTLRNTRKKPAVTPRRAVTPTRTRRKTPLPPELPGSGNTPPPPPALRPTDTPWQRRYAGTTEGVTFHLHLRRHASGVLTGRYSVLGGHEEGFALYGGLYTDGSFLVSSRENGASFRGFVESGGALRVSLFRRGAPNAQKAFRLRHLDLLPTGPREAFRDPDAPEEAPGRPGPPRAWAGTLTGELAGTVLSLRLVRRADGSVDGTFDLRGRGGGTVRGVVGEEDVLTLDARYTTGPREGQRRTVHGTLTHRNDEIVLSARWLGGDEPYPFVARHLHEGTAPLPHIPGSAEHTPGALPKPLPKYSLPALKEPDFEAQFQDVAGRLGVPAHLLLALMLFESWLDPQAVSGGSGAHFGLIQFGREALTDLRTRRSHLTPDQVRLLPRRPEGFRDLSAVQQLPYVEAYLRQHGVPEAVERAREGGREITLEHLYFSVLGGHTRVADRAVWAARDAEDPDERLRYTQNDGLDSDGNGTIEPVEAADILRLRWRNVFGTNLDERALHLRDVGTARRPRAKYDPRYRDPLPLHTAARSVTPEEDDDTTATRDREQEARLRLVPEEELRRIRERGEIGAVIGSLDGVEAYYNGKNEGGGVHYSSDGKKYRFGYRWQCVEFVRRYYYTALNHSFEKLGNAVDYYDPGTEDATLNIDRGLTQFSNGSRSKNARPGRGDLIVFAPSPANGGYGHVAIVVSCSNKELTVAQQNVGTGFTQTFQVVVVNGSWRISGGVLGWLRKGE
ncbi:CHAP domain-containing protein [Deinococcus pimensis]|uniref:CHAP domain-containing protein n=1 Tax=Deinococcus pimensis TaxID=309888 RepID=UPI0004AE4104|nr:CHAP domain-containing protein [Deinococcus pimensis]